MFAKKGKQVDPPLLLDISDGPDAVPSHHWWPEC